MHLEGLVFFLWQYFTRKCWFPLFLDRRNDRLTHRTTDRRTDILSRRDTEKNRKKNERKIKRFSLFSVHFGRLNINPYHSDSIFLFCFLFVVMQKGSVVRWRTSEGLSLATALRPAVWGRGWHPKWIVLIPTPLSPPGAQTRSLIGLQHSDS